MSKLADSPEASWLAAKFEAVKPGDSVRASRSRVPAPTLVTFTVWVTGMSWAVMPKLMVLASSSRTVPPTSTSISGRVDCSIRIASAITNSLAVSVSFTTSVPELIRTPPSSSQFTPWSLKSFGLSSWFSAVEDFSTLPS